MVIYNFIKYLFFLFPPNVILIGASCRLSHERSYILTGFRSLIDVRSVPAVDMTARLTTALDRLRNVDDFRHNVDVLTKDDGQQLLIIDPLSISADEFDEENVLSCRYCPVFFLRRPRLAVSVI